MQRLRKMTKNQDDLPLNALHAIDRESGDIEWKNINTQRERELQGLHLPAPSPLPPSPPLPPPLLAAFRQTIAPILRTVRCGGGRAS